jgi:hypothetical protein
MSHLPKAAAVVRLAGRFRLLMTIALGLLVPMTATVRVSAEDTRPTEIPYDMPGEIPYLDPTYHQTRHEMVIITDNALRPRLITLEEGQLVAWISYSKAASTVVFEREIARSMICHSLVNFSIQDDELRSAEIHTGEFASFCELKPGRYRYKVVRKNPKHAGAGGAARRLEGEIIVGDVP